MDQRRRPILTAKERPINITDVRITLANKEGRLLAFASVIFDDVAVVHDIKIVDGKSGVLVSMPSRHVTDGCPKCSERNWVIARFCSWCGAPLRENRFRLDRRGKPFIHTDLFHPIEPGFRKFIVDAVMDTYDHERQKVYGEPELGSVERNGDTVEDAIIDRHEREAG